MSVDEAMQVVDEAEYAMPILVMAEAEVDQTAAAAWSNQGIGSH